MEEQEFMLMVSVKAKTYKEAVNKIPDEAGEVVGGGLKKQPDPKPAAQSPGQ